MLSAGGPAAGGFGHGGFVWGRGVRGRGGGLGGRGQGTFHPPCHVLHYHMVLRPEGTSHNKAAPGPWFSDDERHFPVFSGLQLQSANLLYVLLSTI